MNALELAGIEFVAGNGSGLGVRLTTEPASHEQFLAFLKAYERSRLRGLARHIDGLPQFGYVFVYHNREGADLMFRGQYLGKVRWHGGRVTLDPPLPPDVEMSLSDELFDKWVCRAEYHHSTGT